MKIRQWAACLSFISLTAGGAFAASQVGVDVSLANTFLKADLKTNTYVKVALTGFELDAPSGQRPPVNVAIVLDRSGSMEGQKLAHAKLAAKEAIQHLGPQDIVSIVLYDSNVSVLVPATKVSDKAAICAEIDKVEVGGSTALFAGVAKGSAEVRKFLNRELVNRVILLSDGIANVGPSSPAALAEFGASLKKDGISVSTIGLGNGYNEDLMYKLADRSDGNHVFAQEPSQLAGIFNKEFGELLSVVAQEVQVKIECKPGVRPIRVLGRESEISGQKVIVSLNQLYSLQQEYVLLEIEVPAGADGETRDLASISVRYANLMTKTEDKLSNSVSVRFAKADEKIQAGLNKDVWAACSLQIATDNNRYAMQLRDEGKIKEAESVLLSNGGNLLQWAKDYDAPELLQYGTQNEMDAKNLDDVNWGRQRKGMIETQGQNFKRRSVVPSTKAPESKSN
jgi:Ca-activated chloride channel family protein